MDPPTFDLQAPPTPACGVTRHVLRRLHAGEFSALERAGLTAHSEACAACQAFLAELRRDDAAFHAQVPLERFLADHRRYAEGAARIDTAARRLRAWLAGGGFALALATGAALLMVPARDGVETVRERLKGKPAALGFIVRTPAGVMAGQGGQHLSAGDQIQFFVRAPRADIALVVVGVDGRGAVTVYHAGLPPPAPQGAPVPLPDSVVLDDALGPERFFAVYGTGKPSALRSAAEEAARSLAAEHADLTVVDTLPLFHATQQDSVLIVKVPK